jgi:diguanylate cyclase (GGDEF)-like protein
MEAQARVDPLTSALNRHAFNTMFVDPAPAQASGTVVLVDIDNLKRLNDTRGHGAGDQAIRDAARVIRHALRADDLVFRWGGDEFLAILFGMSERDADARFRALRERDLGDPSAPQLSWGVAAFEGADTIGPAIETADRAMYASRQRRRGRVAS